MKIIVDNHLFVLTEIQEELEYFILHAGNGESPLSLEQLFPCPEHADKNWKRENWGTAGMRLSHLEYSSAVVAHYYLETEMEPPKLWLQQVARLYPNLCFYMKYSRDGFSLLGGIVAKGAEVNEFVYDEHLISNFLHHRINSDFVTHKYRMFKEFSSLNAELSNQQKLEAGYV